MEFYSHWIVLRKTAYLGNLNRIERQRVFNSLNEIEW